MCLFLVVVAVVAIAAVGIRFVYRLDTIVTGLNASYSDIKYTKKEWVRHKARHYPLQLRYSCCDRNKEEQTDSNASVLLAAKRIGCG